MIEGVQKLIRNVTEWQRALPDIVLESVREHEAEIIDLNVEEQLYQKGIDREGQAIEPAYTPFTVSIKQHKGQITSHVTLRDTGDFHRSFQISYGNDAFAFYATDPKAQKLQKKYGKEIFGLTDQSLQEATDMVREPVFSKSKEIILR